MIAWMGPTSHMPHGTGRNSLARRKNGLSPGGTATGGLAKR